MARTFTGLKLQGEIGSVGKSELSDLEGYVDMPDGKVLSGCESGQITSQAQSILSYVVSNHNPRKNDMIIFLFFQPIKS